jgi:hypothetical protein
MKYADAKSNDREGTGARRRAAAGARQTSGLKTAFPRTGRILLPARIRGRPSRAARLYRSPRRATPSIRSCDPYCEAADEAPPTYGGRSIKDRSRIRTQRVLQQLVIGGREVVELRIGVLFKANWAQVFAPESEVRCGRRPRCIARVNRPQEVQDRLADAAQKKI